MPVGLINALFYAWLQAVGFELRKGNFAGPVVEVRGYMYEYVYAGDSASHLAG